MIREELILNGTCATEVTAHCAFATTKFLSNDWRHVSTFHPAIHEFIVAGPYFHRGFLSLFFLCLATELGVFP